MRLAAFEVYFVGGQVLYHFGMPAIFFYLEYFLNVGTFMVAQW